MKDADWQNVLLPKKETEIMLQEIESRLNECFVNRFFNFIVVKMTTEQRKYSINKRKDLYIDRWNLFEIKTITIKG